MPLPDGDIGRLVTRVDELSRGLPGLGSDELRSRSLALGERPRDGDRSLELTATALALSREALRRTTGALVDSGVVGAVVAAVPVVPGRRDRQLAVAMTLYWHSLAGRGAHFVSWDERGAREALKRYRPAAALLGSDAGLVTPSTVGDARRSAYAAPVTFGSYHDLAADYLRDNLHDSPAGVVQRGLYAAVLDEVDKGLVRHALTQVAITAPRGPARPGHPELDAFAAGMRRGDDYRVDRKRQAVVFSPGAMSRIRSAAGWGPVPSLAEVDTAERLEYLLMHREGLGRRDERETLAEISAQGLLGAYDLVTGFSSGGAAYRSIDDLLTDGAVTTPELRELALERLVDRQRETVYGYRAGVRDEPATLAPLTPIVGAAVQAWLARGEEALNEGVRDVLAGHQDPADVDRALGQASSPPERADRAIRLLRAVTDRRRDELGEAALAALLRTVLLTVVDLQWRNHIRRTRFLQRQSSALYDRAADPDAARNADVAELFAGCEQAIRTDSIKYLLNVPG